MDTFLLKGGTVLNIPQQLILPDTVHEGIVINSAEMRLYYYPKAPTPGYRAKSRSALVS